MKPVELTQFLDFKYVANLSYSPNHKHYAFTVSQANEKKNTYDHVLYIGDNTGIKKHKTLKDGPSIVFYDDDSLLLTWSENAKEKKQLEKEKKQKLYRYNIASKTLEPFATLPFNASVDDVLSSDKLLIKGSLTLKDHVLYQGDDEARKAYLKAQKKEALYETIESIPYYFNGRDFVTEKRTQLFIFDVSTSKLEPLVSAEFNIDNYSVSNDKKSVWLVGKPLEGVRTFSAPIYQYDIDQKSLTLICDTDLNITRIIDLNGDIVVAARDMKSYGLNQNPDFYILQAHDLKPFSTYGQSMHNTVGSDVRYGASMSSFVHQDKFYFVSTLDDHTELMALDTKGVCQRVFTMPGCIDGVIPFKDHFVLTGLKDQKLQEIYTLDAKGSLKQKTRLNTNALKDTYIAPPQTITVEYDTHTVKGFVLLPKDYDPSGSYPAILNIHGGPKTVYGQVYYHEMQYWASLGYVVFFANPRGSDGKGDAFADIRGRYGTIDYDDLMAFTDHVCTTYPAIDTTRLFVTGGSYGGFMTNWIVSHTHRFKAAATQRSIANWQSFYGTSDIGYYFAKDQADGDPIRDREKLYEQSPLKYVDQVKTPLLFIHSDKDHRCPMEQAQQFHTRLKVRGLHTRFIWFKGENHELSRSGKPQARIKRLTEITDWFNQYNYQKG